MLHLQSLSLDHSAFVHCLATHENLLVVQDLDGVCMGLVKDPLTRSLDLDYIKAVQCFEGHFFVLTNGEHIGSRGVNRIVEQSLPIAANAQGYYLPGLAAGGVQWQTRDGQVSHPGVSDKILAFLAQVPQHIETCLRTFFADQSNLIDSNLLDAYIHAAILDNKVSPTANLNVFYAALAQSPDVYAQLQNSVAHLMQTLLNEAQQQQLADSFFLHLAPNLGQDAQGNEIMQPASEQDSGTTDFQFMLRGARKEVGLLFLLNQFVAQRTGQHPLGKDFHVLDAPQTHPELLALIQTHFSPDQIPLMIGVGDTVTSQGVDVAGSLEFRRGGSDRGFLQLIQNIGHAYNNGSFTVYVDSSGGEVQNRKPLRVSTTDDSIGSVEEGPTDPRDVDDPLTLNVAIPGGHQQYIQLFKQAAHARSQNG